MKNEKIIYDNLKKFIDNYTEKSYRTPNYKYNVAFSTKGEPILFKNNELHQLVNNIIEDKVLGKNFSGGAEEFLTNKIMNMITSYKYIKNRSTDYVTQKIINMLKEKKVPYTFFLPVYGIKVSSVYPKKYKNIAICPAKFKKDEINNFIRTKNLKKSDRLSEEMNTTDSKKSYIFIKVYANNSETAKELSLSYANDLILALHSIYSNIDNSYIIGIGDDEDYTSLISALYYKDDGTIKETFRRKDNKSFPLQVDLSLTNSENNILKVFMNILNNKIKNNQSIKAEDIENKIYSSIKYIGRATIESNLEQAFLDLMIAIESLVEEKDFSQNITDQICERCAELLSNELETRTSMYSKLKALYTKRSNLVHGSKKPKITLSDLYYLRGISLQLCIYFVKNIEKFKNINWHDFYLELRFN